MKLSKISAPVAIVLGGAWIVVERGISDGIVFMLIAFALYIAFVVIEHKWEEYKDYHGIGR